MLIIIWETVSDARVRIMEVHCVVLDLDDYQRIPCIDLIVCNTLKVTKAATKLFPYFISKGLSRNKSLRWELVFYIPVQTINI